MQRRSTGFMLFLVCLLLAPSLLAQLQTGNLYGKVQAKDGSALPGVTVTLTGVGAPQTFISDGTGGFHFLNLSPGSYNLKAELAGFGTATRNGVSVNIARNADVTMTLNPAASESITITAEAPLLDVRKTGTGADVSKLELEKIPTARDPWVILQQTPGVQMDRINVGGNQSGQQSGYVSKGSTSDQSTWNVDGVNITDFSATGSSPSYYDFDSFEELQLTTGGSDPRIMTPGVQINMVTKRGTNDIKGSGRAFQTRKAWQASPKIPAEAQSYLSGVNQINRINDDGGEIGGPIIKDKLWFWGAFGKQDINILTTSVLTTGARFQDRTSLKNENLKLNVQPLASNSLTAVDQFGAKIKLGRNVSATRFPETGWNQNNAYKNGTGSLTDPTLWKIEDTQIVNPNLYLTGLYSKVQGGFQLIADNGKGCTTFACGADSLPAYRDLSPLGDGAWHRSYLTGDSLRPQTQYRVDGSAFVSTGTLSHELKFGFGYRKSDVTSHTVWPGGEYTYNYGSGAGDGHDTGLVALPRFPIFTYTDKSQDAYIGDTVMLGNLTVQAGLRYDQQKGSSSAGTTTANSVVPDLMPAASFGASGALKWDNISPRIGLTYALGANRSTLLRAAYNRYANQITSTMVFPTSPGSTAYEYYYFNDVNHNNIAERNEIDFNYGIVGATGIDPAHPASFSPLVRWGSGLKAPHADELILGGEHELFSDFSVGVTGTYRKLSDFIWNVPEKHQGQGDLYTSADYVQNAVNATAILPNGQTVSVPWYHVASGVPIPLFFVMENRPGYYQRYEGLELTATKRMSNRWMMRGSFTFQDWTQHVSSSGIVDPTCQRLTGTGRVQGPVLGDVCSVSNGSQVIIGSGAGSGSFGGVYINSKWSYSLTGAYQIPVIESSIGFNLNGRQGYAIPYVVRVTAPRGEGAKNVIVPSSVDEFRNPNVSDLDLRLAKDFHISRAGLTVSLDAFNVLNSNTILQRNVTRLGTASASTGAFTPLSASNRVTEVLSPRVFRVGARVTF